MKWINNLDDKDKKLKKEIEKDIHEHVKKLVSQIQKLEKKVDALKQKSTLGGITSNHWLYTEFECQHPQTGSEIREI